MRHLPLVIALAILSSLTSQRTVDDRDQGLIRELKTGTCDRQKTAASAIKELRIKSPEVVQALIDHSRAAVGGDCFSECGAVQASDALGQMDSVAVPILVRNLGKSAEDCGLLARALGIIGRPAVPSLSRLVASSTEPLVRRADAADALGHIAASAEPQSAEGAIPSLVRGLESDDPDLLRFVMLALGQMGAKATSATPRLVILLGHPDRPTREYSAYTLGQLGVGAAAAVPSLARAAQQLSDLGLQGAAVDALGEIGPSAASAVPMLDSLLSNTGVSDAMRRRIVVALSRIRGGRP